MVKHKFIFFRKFFKMSKITKLVWTGMAVLMFISAAPALINSIKDNYEEMLKSHVKVASVKISGEIKEIDDYVKDLTKYFKNKEIKAILLEIDSPGGAAGSSQALFNEIQCLKKEYPKPIVCLTNNICASGGYYIAATADYIITSQSALVGSIGTYIGFFNVDELLKKYNVAYVAKYTGAYKTLASPLVARNPENEKLLQALADSCYDHFTRDMANCRKLDLKEVNNWANGKVFTGEQALKLRLVDENGSKYNAIKKIKELAAIKEDEEITWVKTKEPNVITKFLEGHTQTSVSPQAIVDQVIAKLQTGFISCN